jgi:hypothetical protein
MEKNIIKNNLILIISFSSFFFFWDCSILNFQLRFLILLPLIASLFSNYFLIQVFNIKSIIFLIIFVHLLFNVNKNFNFFYFASFFFLFFISIIIKTYRDYILENFEKFIYFFIVLLSLSIIFYVFVNYQMIDSHYVGNFFQLSKLIFKENSHLGMVVPSVIIFFIYKYSIKKNYHSLAIIFILLSIIFLSYSLTAFAGLILSCTVLIISNYSVIKKQLFYLIILVILSSLQIFTNNQIYSKFLNSTAYFYNLKSQIISDEKRISDEKNVTPNLSIEVYLTSLKIAFYSLKVKPFGYGLNNYQSASSEHISKIYTTNKETQQLNLQDGSNNFSKIVTEFGFFSILLLFFAYKFIFSKKIDLSYKFLIVPNLITQTFIRGAGYFNGGYIVFLLLLIFLVYEKELKNNN